MNTSFLDMSISLEKTASAVYAANPAIRSPVTTSIMRRSTRLHRIPKQAVAVGWDRPGHRSLDGLEQRRRVGNFLGNVVANRERGLVHFYLIVPRRIFEHRAHGPDGFAGGVGQRYRH